MNKLKLESGFLYGEKLISLFDFCKANNCAIPAVNVSSSNTINAALSAAAQVKSPIIIQLSHSGSAFFAGKSLDNSQHQASVLGAASVAMYVKALAAAYGVTAIIHSDHCPKKKLAWVDGMLEIGEEYYADYGEPLFSSHMLDLSEETVDDNIKISARYLRRLSELEMLLEIEIGLTGGEEDGLNNESAELTKLYSKPEDVLQAYERLNSIGNVNIAASFGNVHGVYQAKSVKLKPEILRDCQSLVSQKIEKKDKNGKPLNLVFHGGSGSDPLKIKESLKYGVVKFNIDTDTQWAFASPIKKYMDKNDQFLHSQVGNKKDKSAPNKKYIDPRVWLSEGENGMTAKLVEMFELLNCKNKFEILD